MPDADLEQEHKAIKEQVRNADRETLAKKRALKSCQAACRKKLRHISTLQSQRKARERHLARAQGALQNLRKCGKRTVAAQWHVGIAKRKLQKCRQEVVDAKRELTAAKSERSAALAGWQKAAMRRDRLHDALKVHSLKVRQKKSASKAAASRHRHLQALHQKQAAARKTLAAQQQKARQRLEEKLQAELVGFKRKAADRASEQSAKQRRRLSTYAAMLRKGEPRHADKFHRKGACWSLQRAEQPELPNWSGRVSTLHPSRGKHEYTLVYLHQFCCDGPGYVDWKPHYFFSATKLSWLHLKVIFPTAKAIPITAHGGAYQYAWYDYRTDYDGEREDVLCRSSLRDTRDRIFKILDREIALLGGDASRVFLGGASQGCCTALHCALQYPRLLGGFVGILGHLLSASPVPARKREMPFYLFNGRDDMTMRWGWVRQTYDRFRHAGFTNVHVRCEAGVTHYKPKNKERQWILEFLTKRLRRDGPVRTKGPGKMLLVHVRKSGAANSAKVSAKKKR
mmetsp:Transcript_66773/g.159737  ORF Transcript_66773/g.159737 Transcript_66773/m.159737 type:complete len:512 (-) Transcript_66773:13-1548(-)